MKIDVTNTKLSEIKKIVLQLRKIYKTVHLKSRGTKKGRKTFIMFEGRKK